MSMLSTRQYFMSMFLIFIDTWCGCVDILKRFAQIHNWHCVL